MLMSCKNQNKQTLTYKNVHVYSINP